MYPIHCSQERFEREFGYPKGTEITHVPYNGEPFSAFTVVSKNNKSIYVQFGTGGYHPEIAYNYLENQFTL